MNKRTNQTANSPKISKALLDKLSDGVLLVDKNDQILYANRAAIALSDKEEVVGRHLTPLLKLPDSNGRIPSHSVLFHLPNASTNALATFFDVQDLPGIQRLAKRSKHLVLLQVPSRNETSPASAYQLILGNLTVRIAHDFNNDLSSILGDAEYIQTVLEALSSTNAEVNSALPVIGGIIRRCLESAQTVKQLQEYARQQPRARDVLDLNESITSVIPIGRRILGQKIKLDFIPTEDLPPLYGDRVQLDQVLMSLLIASKETMPAGGAITITTKISYIDQEYVDTHPGSRPGHYLLLTVQDTGTGITQDPTELFSPTTATQTGLRLPNAYAIVKQQLSGYFDVEGWEGQGTRFEIYLPIYKQEISESTPAAQLTTKTKRPSRRTRRTVRRAKTQPAMILIAEDDADIRRTIESHLQHAGYRTAAATNGISALELFAQLTKEKNKPALVISDLGLPGIDGKSLCKRIHDKHKRTELLLTSGHSVDMNSQGSKTIDGFNFLQKPFTAAILLALIDQILNSPNTN
jgi:two-component system cell cycle sensor histidine kinase/response regulator CckA